MDTSHHGLNAPESVLDQEIIVHKAAATFLFSLAVPACAALFVSAPLFAPTSVHAQTPLKAGEYYMISRLGNDHFVGSQFLLTKPQKGYLKVTYCGVNYWVRPESVSWSEAEAKAGRTVAIEFNKGNGWREVCADPEKQVRLSDLDLNRIEDRFSKDPRLMPKNSNRYKAISEAFSKRNDSSLFKSIPDKK